MHTSDVSQPYFSQIGAGSAEIRIFFIFISSPKTLNSIFSKYIFQTLHIISSFFGFNPAIGLVFFWNMLIWVPIAQFCGKFRIHLSHIGNLLLERITITKKMITKDFDFKKFSPFPYQPWLLLCFIIFVHTTFPA